MNDLNVPDIIGGAQVVCYAVVNLTIPTGNTHHFGKGELLESAYGIAICKYQNEEGYYLFSCDHNWKEFADTWHETIKDAQVQAEFEYAGIVNNWKYK